MKIWMIGMALCALALGAEKKIQMNDLPAAVRQAVQEQTKGAEIKGLSKETENGRTEYEVETVLDSKSRDLTFDASGKVVEVEQEVGIDSLPAAARAAIEKRAMGGKIVKVETVTRGSVTTYEASYTKGGRTHEIGVKADGSPVKD
jgi:Putative beta-lactamase-inhibitor-like, PepSY-like